MPLAITCNFSGAGSGDPPAGVVGTAFSHFFVATGGSGTYVFYVSNGHVPSGLVLDPNTGELAGTPNTDDWTPAQIGANSASYGFTLVVFDGTDWASVVCGMGTYINCLPLTPSCDDPPVGTIGLAYTHSFSAVQGIAPYSFAVTGGALPGGLSMDGSGNVTGVPTTNGFFAFFITVTGSDSPINNVATISCTIDIGGTGAADSTQLYYFAAGFIGDIEISCNNPPAGLIGQPYSHYLAILPGGIPPYTFSIIFGALPDGLTLDAASGLISGTPTTLGVFGFTAHVEDSSPMAPETDSVECSISIFEEDLAIEGTPPPGQVGIPYSFGFTPVGGAGPPYTFSGTFCDGFGLALAADGTLSGTPLIAGTCCFAVTVTDVDLNQATQNECVTIKGCLLVDFSS